MRTFSEAITYVLNVLNEAGVDYMIVGSVAASVHGFVRDTHDLDVVIALELDAVSRLAEMLGDDFYLSEDAAREAIKVRDMFNVIDVEGGAKVDFWVLKNAEFAREQFERRQPAAAWGVPTYVESAEDTILSKLLWYKITPSERQLSDVKGILVVKKDELDYDYLRRWAIRLDVNGLLDPLINSNLEE